MSQSPTTPEAVQERMEAARKPEPAGAKRSKSAAAQESEPGEEPARSAGKDRRGHTSAKSREETVPTHTDNPAIVDELGRRGFARVLARRIRDVRVEEGRNAKATNQRESRGGAFLVHLHAPWGAGKTSLLNFLGDELRREDPERCVVVNFNAWRHQRIIPPWWWLMTAMYAGAATELTAFRRRRAIALRAREWLWRLKGGWPGYVMTLLGAAVLVAVWRAGFLAELSGGAFLSFNTFKGILIAAAALVTPALTVWGFLRAISRWIFATSARGARRFMDHTKDPLGLVREHFGELVDWIGYDVVILIDDLDRCKGPYVVELLEGIQTLFRDVPVTYVVAADRDWLSDSYATEYGGFVGRADEPGRPMGYRFLEKTFQISTSLPSAGTKVDTFWTRLLHSPSLPSEADLERARDAARAELGGQETGEARRQVAAHPGSSPVEVQARLEAVAVEMATERAAQQAVHTLAPFRNLLGRDPNPRMMKRLVNAYGIARGVETLHAYNLEDDHLREQTTALWTILNLRWPRLGAHLSKHPEDVDLIGSGRPLSDVPTDLQPLFVDEDVLAVVRGEAQDVHARLNGQVMESVLLR